ncbi:uncharacterized protein LOC126617112 [Malus sylvestris]|uniref:uncharacterized protein LOC126617112 n=1 Tax=Malus sylvestris TaxID=3752 RepID=UPI0021AC3948|nr:uncharacterized protein LOC126617112 [Malus sylvestris]
MGPTDPKLKKNEGKNCKGEICIKLHFSPSATNVRYQIIRNKNILTLFLQVNVGFESNTIYTGTECLNDGEVRKAVTRRRHVWMRERLFSGIEAKYGEGFETFRPIGPLKVCVVRSAKARASPVSGALCGPSTVISEQGSLYLHRHPDAVLNEQGGYRNFFSNDSTQSCLGAYAPINFTRDTQKKYFDPIRQGRVKKLGQKGRVQESKMRLGTWNIGTLTGKSMEVVEVMVRRRINIMCLQETKWVGRKAKDLENSGFKLWYSGTNRTRNGVGIIVDKTLTQDVVDVKRVGDRIMAIKIVIGQELINVISAYAPQVGLDTSSKEKFWEDLGDLVQGIAQTEKLFIGGDLNGHVGRETGNYGGFHGGHGFGERNKDGEAILDFAMAYDLFLANTFFKKREEHVITYKSGSSKTQIDFLLMRKGDRITCKDCKVIPGESMANQHRLLVMDVHIKREKKEQDLEVPKD